jgi:hypothetical protein
VWLFCDDSILKRCIRPAATQAKITKTIGWHTFRRTFSTLLKANGEDVKVIQELLRHASTEITLDVEAQAVTSDKRRAQTKVADMLLTGLAGDFLWQTESKDLLLCRMHLWNICLTQPKADPSTRLRLAQDDTSVGNTGDSETIGHTTARLTQALCGYDTTWIE